MFGRSTARGIVFEGVRRMEGSFKAKLVKPPSTFVCE
jgi:hypothetical protein